METVVIAGAARTPMGGFQGDLAPLNAAELGGSAIAAALAGSGAAAGDVDEVLMGCVLPAGQGQAPARQAGFLAGLGEEVPATTLNKMCGSGMKAAMIAWDRLALGHADVIAAGGMESMTNAPYLLPAMRGGARIGHQTTYDHMFLDGLEDAYDKGRLMGTFAEDCAEAFQFTREQQDDYALGSLSNALAAIEGGAFDAEVAPVTVRSRAGDKRITTDEQPAKARPEKIPHLKPAFREGGTVTAANSSSISDGAAALLLASERAAEAKRAKHPRAYSGPRLPCAGTVAIPDGPGSRRAEIAGTDRVGGRRRGLLGGERSLRGRPHGLHAGTRRPAREDERERRCLRAGPSDRGLGRADHGHAPARDGGARPQARRRGDLHRGRRRHGIMTEGETAIERV
jgi:acetyl-CoA acetyltransferase family protein